MLIWQHIVAWARHDLTKESRLIELQGRSEWQITQAGLDWLAQHPDIQHVEPAGNTHVKESRQIVDHFDKNSAK